MSDGGTLKVYFDSAYNADKNKAFAGWYTTKTFDEGTKVDSLYGYKPTKDTTFYAKWEEGYTVTFDANGGYFQSNTDLTTLTMTVKKGSSTNATPYFGPQGNPENADSSKAFEGWYTTKTCDEGTKIDSVWSYVPTASVTLYVKWSVAYTVTIDANGGYMDSNHVSKKVFKVTAGNSLGQYVSEPVNLNGNLAFDGWYTTSTFDAGTKIDNINSGYKPTSDVTIYAKWIEGYAVTFNAGAGYFQLQMSTSSTYTTRIPKGSKIGYLNNPNITDSSLVFGGWYTDEGLTNKVEDIYNYVPTASMTFYAKWNSCYSVTLNANGGYFNGTEGYTTAALHIAKGSAIGSSSWFPGGPTNSDSGLSFDGWYTDTSFITKIENIWTYVPTADVTFFAKWAGTPVASGSNATEASGSNATEASGSNAIEVTSMTDAAANLLDGLVARKSRILLQYTGGLTSINSLSSDIFNEAIEPTDNSYEGDALNQEIRSWSATTSSGGAGISLDYTVSYRSDAEQEKAIQASVTSTLNSLDLGSLDDLDKIKAIYRYVCNYVNYDNSLADASHSAYAAAINGSAVCQGYSSYFYRLCKAAGIGCRIETGTATGADLPGGGGNHAWNAVEINGTWYNVDCTWDSNYDGNIGDYQYFLKSNASFAADHVNDGKVTVDADKDYSLGLTYYTIDWKQETVDFAAGYSMSYIGTKGVYDVKGVEGDEKTFTITPDPDITGLSIESVTVTGASGTAVQVTKDGNNFTFTMPAENVTACVNYETSRVKHSITWTAGGVSTQYSRPSVAEAYTGDEKTFTVKPATTGIVFAADITRTTDNAEVPVTFAEEDPYTFSFTMPDDNIKIAITFEKAVASSSNALQLSGALSSTSKAAVQGDSLIVTDGDADEDELGDGAVIADPGTTKKQTGTVATESDAIEVSGTTSGAAKTTQVEESQDKTLVAATSGGGTTSGTADVVNEATSTGTLTDTSTGTSTDTATGTSTGTTADTATGISTGSTTGTSTGTSTGTVSSPKTQ